MRLLATSGFTRASRNVRVRHCFPGLAEACLRRPPSRWASAQAAVKREDILPDAENNPVPRSGPLVGADIFSTKQNAEASGSTSRLIEELKKQNIPNKVLQNDGQSGVLISSNPYVFDEVSNLSPSILEYIGRELYSIPNHPICITRKLIESVFQEPTFKNHIASDPVVTTISNFDVLGFPKDHPGRSRTDTYYVDSSKVLRTHTSAHQLAAFQHMLHNSEKGYTICADVFRRDSIDRSHFPVFHQMEGARLWKLDRRPQNQRQQYEMHVARREQIVEEMRALPKHDLELVEVAPTLDLERNPPQVEHEHQEVRAMVTHLMKSLEGLVQRVFTAAREGGVGGFEPHEKLKVRWVEAYFPFTSPSFELEVYWQGEWLELLGSGIVKQQILRNAGLEHHVGWAWGLGVERLAMILFGIPDIRLFWSQDQRFLQQFEAGKIKKYEPFSKFPACYKDVAFWIEAAPAAASPIVAESTNSTGVAAAAGGDATKALPTDIRPAAFHENDVMEIVRDVAGSLAEDVKLVDEFVHPTKGKKSLCYRVNYRSLERTLTNDEVNKMHNEVCTRLAAELPIQLRS